MVTAGQLNLPPPTGARPLCPPDRRFPGRTHHVWLEPEGLDTDVVYPNGISNSLEPEDQLRLLATIPGAVMVVVVARGGGGAGRQAAAGG